MNDQKVVLIGCGRRKGAVDVAAKDLYTGCLFKARREYAERAGCRWWIVSACHELLDPEKVIAPYNWRMEDIRGEARVSWGCRVLRELQTHAPLAELVEVHAGAPYFLALHRAKFEKMAARFEMTWPVEGLTQGYQLRWYAQKRAARELQTRDLFGQFAAQSA